MRAERIFRIGSLESFLHREIGIEENAALAYLSDGRRLRTDNVRDLAGAQDQVRLGYAFHIPSVSDSGYFRIVHFHHSLVHPIMS